MTLRQSAQEDRRGPGCPWLYGASKSTCCQGGIAAPVIPGRASANWPGTQGYRCGPSVLVSFGRAAPGGADCERARERGISVSLVSSPPWRGRPSFGSPAGFVEHADNASGTGRCPRRRFSCGPPCLDVPADCWAGPAARPHGGGRRRPGCRRRRCPGARRPAAASGGLTSSAVTT